LVEVTKVEVSEKRGTGRNGKPYLIREQLAWAQMGKEYPISMSVSLGDDDAPYQPGKYQITEECLFIDRYGQLAVGRVKLQRVAASAAAARA
jgi:hypothetical protein